MATKDRTSTNKSKIDNNFYPVSQNKIEPPSPFPYRSQEGNYYYFKKRIEIRGGKTMMFAWEVWGIDMMKNGELITGKKMALSCLRTATDRYNFVESSKEEYEAINKEFKRLGRRIQNVL